MWVAWGFDLIYLYTGLMSYLNLSFSFEFSLEIFIVFYISVRPLTYFIYSFSNTNVFFYSLPIVLPVPDSFSIYLLWTKLKVKKKCISNLYPITVLKFSRIFHIHLENTIKVREALHNALCRLIAIVKWQNKIDLSMWKKDSWLISISILCAIEGVFGSYASKISVTKLVKITKGPRPRTFLIHPER